MTRFLSEALQAPEPYFRQGLRHLEAANGRPNYDIQLSVAVEQATRDKLRQLGLDPATDALEAAAGAICSGTQSRRCACDSG